MTIISNRGPGRPFISIVIPVKNEESYICGILKNLKTGLQEIGIQYEIVVVDGGSTDGTLACCASADIVITETAERKQTIAKARNIGAKASDGEIIFQTDADVLIPDPSHFFWSLYEIFANPTVVGVTGEIRPYPWSARRRDRVWHWIGNGVIQLSHPFNIYFSRGEFQAIRTSAFRAVGGYNENLAVGEDWDLFRRLTAVGRVRYVRQLGILHSPRRFVRFGYLKMLAIYVREFIFIGIFKRSYLEKWHEVRLRKNSL